MSATRRLCCLLALAQAALLSLAGCADGPPPIDRQGIVQDSAGIRIVDLPPRDAGPAERLLELDAAWGPEPGLEIGELADVAVAPDGRVILLDALAARVLVLAPDGALETSFGRPGSGPGELEPQGLGPLGRLVPTDTSVFVPDLAQQRLTEFSLDGRVLRTLAFPPPGGYAIDWRRHPRDGLALRLSTVRGDLVLRMTDGGVDTLHVFPAVDTPFNTLLAPTPIWDLTAAGEIVAGRSDRPAVELRRPGSDEIRWIARVPNAGGPLAAEARAYLEDLVIATAEEEMGGARLDADGRAQLLGMVSFPARTPVFGQIRVAPDGTVWLRHAREPTSMDREALRPGSAHGWGGASWDVLDEDGTLRERVRFPDGFRPRTFHEGWVYGIAVDDLGLQTPRRVRTGVP